MEVVPESVKPSNEYLVEDGFDDDAHRFASVLNHLQKAKIVPLALATRQQQASSLVSPGATLGDPLCGSFHILFPISFADGIK